jgi:hypothetical protein
MTIDKKNLYLINRKREKTFEVQEKKNDNNKMENACIFSGCL